MGRRPPPANVPLPHTPRLRVVLDWVELAAGGDGLLDGGVEPCVVLGAFEVLPSGAALLARGHHAMGTIARFPHTEAIGEELLEARLTRGHKGHVGLLCLVLEHDSGQDISKLFADLATPSRFAVYESHAAVPAPMSVAQLISQRSSLPPHADPVHLLRDHRPVEDQMKRDDWIAASLIRLPVGPIAQASRWTIPARSEDRRNDWTVWLQVSVAAQ